jgi:hypothetical protein
MENFQMILIQNLLDGKDPIFTTARSMPNFVALNFPLNLGFQELAEAKEDFPTTQFFNEWRCELQLAHFVKLIVIIYYARELSAVLSQLVGRILGQVSGLDLLIFWADSEAIVDRQNSLSRSFYLLLV